MRLSILNSGYGFGTKVLFAFIHAVSRQPVPDAAKLVFYRSDFYGAPMNEFTHEAMRRKPSAWSVGDRELMAAFVSQMMRSPFALVHTPRPQRGRIMIRRKSPPCFRSGNPPLRDRSGQHCACWAS